MQKTVTKKRKPHGFRLNRRARYSVMTTVVPLGQFS